MAEYHVVAQDLSNFDGLATIPRQKKLRQVVAPFHVKWGVAKASR